MENLLKLGDKFANLGSSVSSTEKDISMRLTKVWTAINRLTIMWKSDQSDKIKRNFFKVAVMSILLYRCTKWTMTKRIEKRLDGYCKRMLRAILKKSWKQHPVKQQLYGHLPPISKAIEIRWTRHEGNCWESKDKLIRDILLWTPSHGRASDGWPATTYLQHLCTEMGCYQQDLLEAMDNRDEWRERVRKISAVIVTWWWWWWWWWWWLFFYKDSFGVE